MKHGSSTALGNWPGMQGAEWHYHSTSFLLVSAPDPNQPQHGLLPELLEEIHAGVGLGLGPRLISYMLAQPDQNHEKISLQYTLVCVKQQPRPSSTAGLMINVNRTEIVALPRGQ